LKPEISSTLLRIQYATESAKRQKSNQGTIDKYVRKKREFMLDAAMVRVMKARNAIKWTQFQTEVLKLVQKEWTPSAKEMKKKDLVLLWNVILSKDLKMMRICCNT